eukprot:8500782-Heterocapsa_arctica.AAC.1
MGPGRPLTRPLNGLIGTGRTPRRFVTRGGTGFTSGLCPRAPFESGYARPRSRPPGVRWELHFVRTWLGPRS